MTYALRIGSSRHDIDATSADEAWAAAERVLLLHASDVTMRTMGGGCDASCEVLDGERSLGRCTLSVKPSPALANPRPIPLDARWIDRSTGAMVFQVMHRARSESPVASGEILGETVVRIVRPGETDPAMVTITAVASDARPSLSTRYLTGAELDPSKGVVLYLSAQAVQKLHDADSPPSALGAEIRSAILHEVTHAAEPRLRRYRRRGKPLPVGPVHGVSEETMRHWANDPQEVRALGQELADSAVSTAPFIWHVWRAAKAAGLPTTVHGQAAHSYVDYLIMGGPTDASSVFRRYMTPQSQRRVRLLVERALRDAGIDSTGAEP